MTFGHGAHRHLLLGTHDGLSPCLGVPPRTDGRGTLRFSLSPRTTNRFSQWKGSSTLPYARTSMSPNTATVSSAMEIVKESEVVIE